MSLTSIIIPTFNGLPLLTECIEAIQKYTDAPYEIIVIDNGSTDGTAAFCKANHVRFISLPDNRGFPIACNYGMLLASGDNLLLLNNDVVVSHRWLSNMLNGLHSSSSIGIVGPVTNYVSGKQKVDVGYDSMDEFHWMADAMNRPDRSRWQDVSRIVGLCFLFKRELMDRIGILDERFSPGHYEDDDYCYRSRQAGYRLLITGDVLVHHHGSASFRKQGQEELDLLVERNYQKFIDKWGVDPRSFI